MNAREAIEQYDLGNISVFKEWLKNADKTQLISVTKQWVEEGRKDTYKLADWATGGEL